MGRFGRGGVACVDIGIRVIACVCVCRILLFCFSMHYDTEGLYSSFSCHFLRVLFSEWGRS